MPSFEGAVTSGRDVAQATVSLLMRENVELREELARTKAALREANILLSQKG